MSTSSEKSVKISISTGTITRFFGILLILAAVYFLSNLVLVILTSIVLASFVSAGSRKLAKLKINRTLSVILIYIISIGILAGIFYIFIPLLLDEMSTLFVLISKYVPLSTSQSQTVIGATHAFSNISSLSFTDIFFRFQTFASSISNGFFDTLSFTFGGILNLILIIVLSFYLSIEEHGIENFLRIVLPIQNKESGIELWKRTERKLALWVRGQLLLGLIVGSLIFVGLAITGMKYALIMGLVAGVFELVPFGIVLAAIPAVLFAYTDGGVTLSFIVLGLYFIVHQFEVYLIQPLVIRKVVGVSPLIVIISLLIGAQLFGFWGLILAVPFAVAILEFIDHISKNKEVIG